MPKYNPTDEDMESLYSDPSPETKEATETEKPETKPEGDGEGDEEDTSETLIAKSALPNGVKEGDVIRVRVVKDYGDECGLEVVSDGGKQETKTMSVTDEADTELAALDKE